MVSADNKYDKEKTYVMGSRHNETMEKMSRLNASLCIKLVEDQPMSKVQLTYISRNLTSQGIAGSISTLLAKRQKEEEGAKKIKGKEKEKPGPQKQPSTPIVIPLTLVLSRCQEIGLVTFMFFFELLFSYLSLTIFFYVSLTNLFSIILFLIC